MGYRKYLFWVHGVDVHVQNEPYPADHIKRYSRGTTIKQNIGGNWFHFAIPTPTLISDHEVIHVNAGLRGKINGQATIKKVHIYRGGMPRIDKIYPPHGDPDYEPGRGLSNRVLDESFDCEHERCEDPLVMCIYVEFENGGEITFAGAGVRFDEQR